ncbi:pirin family protein [Nesterenkonia sp. HG001]|uniref:pirin family protein n=1 Tax=Nesterenkonia sp. HG001 TaxID=2983207 RepID=UPI002AC7982E|nr:pirin family protein [Nesterenkonia sp. HG001]MDZ5077253.1 pirin family protein [Nesterenkonia sp. HG001]
MSNTERDPQEQLCVNGSQASGGLRDGVAVAESGVEVLEPRDVPLGGPRAMNVRRTLPQRARSLVGAWCFLDFFGPHDVTEFGPMRIPRHPHTGLATVSWLFSGRIDHLDSAGHWATVRPGELALMNAGRGISHSEHSAADTTMLHGAQLWYAFPDEHRFVEPSLDAHRPETVAGEGWEAKVFLGELLGSRSPARTYIPLTGAELRLEPGAVLDIEVPPGHEHGLLSVRGAVRLHGADIPADHLGVVGAGPTVLRVEAGAEPVLALLIGGEPLDEQIVMWWNFVGRSHEEVAAYRAAYQAEMGFETPPPGSPMSVRTDAALGAPVQGELREALAGATYEDGLPFPQFGDFPPGQDAPLPAPALPTARMKPRG